MYNREDFHTSVLMITGHRPQHLGGFDRENSLNQMVIRTIEEEMLKFKERYQQCWFISGMALGVDTWALEIALKIGIPSTAAIPFVGQETRWQKKDQDHYKELLFQCREQVVVSEGSYQAYKMIIRDTWMVNNANYCMAVYNPNRNEGGTLHTFKIIKKSNKPYIWIVPSIPCSVTYSNFK